MLVEAWRDLPRAGRRVADNFARETGSHDGGFAHDDLPAVNERGLRLGLFAAHARRARAGRLRRRRARPPRRRAGVGPALPIASLAGDAVRVRGAVARLRATARSSARRSSRPSARRDPGATGARRASPPSTRSDGPGYMQRAMLAGATSPRDPLGDWLAGSFPAVKSYAALASALRARGVARDDLPARVARGLHRRRRGTVHAAPIPMAVRPWSRPSATAIARWQADHRPSSRTAGT